MARHVRRCARSRHDARSGARLPSAPRSSSAPWRPAAAPAGGLGRLRARRAAPSRGHAASRPPRGPRARRTAGRLPGTLPGLPSRREVDRPTSAEAGRRGRPPGSGLPWGRPAWKVGAPGLRSSSRAPRREPRGRAPGVGGGGPRTHLGGRARPPRYPEARRRGQAA